MNEIIDRTNLQLAPMHALFMRFMDEILDRDLFTIKFESLPLTVLGAEIKGGCIWVYQETPAPEKLGPLSVRHDALREIYPDQVNRVNVKYGIEVRSLIFTGFATSLVAALAE